MIVALAGSDGVGKTTAICHLAEELRRAGKTVRSVGRWDIVDNPAYPATRFIHSDIEDLRQCVASMPPVPRFTFLMWTMHMALEPYARLDEPSIVIVDGYWMKHAASEIAYGVEESYIGSITTMLPRADLTFLLDAPVDLLYERKVHDLVAYECAMDPACSRESFVLHQTTIRTTLHKWQREFNWIKLDAARPVPEVVGDMARAILR